MKLTSAIIFTLIGVVLVLSKKLDKKLAAQVKVWYYTSLLECTEVLSTKIFETKQILEKTISKQANRNHTKRHQASHSSQQSGHLKNETAKLNHDYNELITFIHRFQLAKSVMQQENLLPYFISINKKLKDVKRMVRRFMKKVLKMKIVDKKSSVSNENMNKTQILTTLKDMQTSLRFMEAHFSEGKSQ